MELDAELPDCIDAEEDEPHAVGWGAGSGFRMSRYEPQEEAVVTISETANRRERASKHRILRGDPMGGLSLSVAQGTRDVIPALRLVHDSYVELGLINPHPSRLRLLPHHLLPETRVFLAREYDEVVATLTLIPDSSWGLPLDEAYGERISRLRTDGRKVAELSCLALAPRYRRHDVLLYLFRLMHCYVRATGYDDLCVVVAPKHGRFYERILLFQRYGGFKHLGRLNGAPALLFRQDLRTIEQTTRSFYDGVNPRSDLYEFFFASVRLSEEAADRGRGLDSQEVGQLVDLCPEISAAMPTTA